MKYFITIVAVAFLATIAVAEDPWTPNPLCPFPSYETIRFPYEGDCSKYWECYQGARYPMDCPAGLEFNAEYSRCDTPSLANCDSDATIVYPTFPHSTVTVPAVTTPDHGPVPECPFPSNELIFFPVATNCSLYWECFQGQRFLMSCPPRLVWNTLANFCDYPANVDCSRNNATTTSKPVTPTSPGNVTTTSVSTVWTPDPECPYPSPDTIFFPDLNDCSKYYECYQGNKYLMSCPPNLYWNDLEKACDYLENVNCNRTSTPVSNTTTPLPTAPTAATTRDPICIGQPDGTYLAHPTDCSKFIECVGDKAIEEKCAADLLWNPSIKSCDYPANVSCPNRVAKKG